VSCAVSPEHSRCTRPSAWLEQRKCCCVCCQGLETTHWQTLHKRVTTSSVWSRLPIASMSKDGVATVEQIRILQEPHRATLFTEHRTYTDDPLHPVSRQQFTETLDVLVLDFSGEHPTEHSRDNIYFLCRYLLSAFTFFTSSVRTVHSFFAAAPFLIFVSVCYSGSELLKWIFIITLTFKK